jgi:Trypsin-like peptidase domain
MPLGFEHLQGSVRIIGIVDGRKKVIGTGFTVVLPGVDDPSFVHGYVVTAAHVLKGKSSIEVQAANPHGGLNEAIELREWHSPLPQYDVAIGRWPSRSQQFWTVHPETFADLLPLLGQTIYYVGILTALGQPIPMVRTGSLAAMDVEGLRLEHGYSFPAHLIDCRSYDGFSGSPCFLQTALMPIDPPNVTIDQIPEGMEKQAMLNDGVSSASRPALFTYFVGMFTNHTTNLDAYDPDDLDENGLPVNMVNRHGIGVMLPARFIVEALMSDEMANERRQVEADGQEPPVIIAGASAGQAPADRDERVSLHPLTGDQALRGLLDTPPDPKA